jgi:hypothetical protein
VGTGRSVKVKAVLDLCHEILGAEPENQANAKLFFGRDSAKEGSQVLEAAKCRCTAGASTHQT